ncbi:transcription termination factor 1, mitochondrial [Hemicordylus capensis]|uniref:transcription termination factor 1, mitochondrial n=1 Tax=Hemicordylus capensis TaxID=884348 RepID=UPI00230384C7|nr:transcription termination factor 1, mitochondrial [Hemicordylus capensis]XP_053121309.1 transcription termination factor 1, mitochondrial [Hemicordylus capensis]XP_053121310.1 transcription termination factor 1, mitochondrial [Hemicordylus capensis]XP_053121311.1 transcription termination factor 1, mitochondrial [Hemicordylus capensis]XP_053121312.1 transcription termination factor 1, mitochondrial [Hemicordylus capensis]XP_053121313.1 transcription termination factor 1, mitochondrial [Hemi
MTVNVKNIVFSNMNVSWLLRLSREIVLKGAATRFLCLKAGSSNAVSDKENDVLVSSLIGMGVDVHMVRKRQPGVLKKQHTNEKDLKSFLQAKGANQEAIANIISRYPRAITRSYQSLNERWEIWRSILMTDLEIITILQRSPESFFRSGNNANMEKNIALFCSLGLSSKELGKMLTRTPRVFSNSMELNKQMIGLLNEIYLALGGENPDEFVKQIISKNGFILLRSIKQVKANVQFLQSSFALDDKELITLLHGQGGDLLDLSNEYLKKTLANVKEKLLSHGCTETEVDEFVLKHPRILYLSPQNLNDKIDFLLATHISIQQILKSPLVLDKSLNTIISRIKDLEKADYNFGIQGITILALSKQRFENKLEKLDCT